MASLNGRTDIVGAPIQLGDFFPERRYVELNGEKYLAWVTTNRRYPRSVMAKLDKAARTYNRVISPLLEPAAENAEPDPLRQAAADNQPEAWEQYVTDAILLLIPTLLETEIELVSLPILEGLLQDLGYFSAPSDATEPVVPTDDNEAKPSSDPLTGGSLPDASVGFTPDIPIPVN